MARYLKTCQFCALAVPIEAFVCPHCTRDIDTPEGVRARLEAIWKARMRDRNHFVIAVVVGIVVLTLPALIGKPK